MPATTDTTYTTQPPTEPGWYWAKHLIGFELIVNVIRATDGGLIGSNGENTFSLRAVAQWGPKVPSAETLFRLADDRSNLLKACQSMIARFPDGGALSDMLIRDETDAIRAAIAKATEANR